MVNKTITAQDVCEKCACKEQEHFIDMSDFYVDDYRKIISHLKPLNIWGVDVTVMDLFNIPLDTDAGIKDFIWKRLEIDINTPQWIEKINSLFEQTVDFYQTRYLKKIPVRFSKIKFQNAQSLINFLHETKTNKVSGAINCALAKVSYAIDDVLSNEKVRRERFLDQQFIREHLERPFQIDDSFEDENGNIYRIGKVVVNDGGTTKIINFKLISRQKWMESIIGKQLAEAKYYSVDQFRDLVWVTIYLKDDAEAALMMQFIDQMIYKWTAEIKNKNGLDLQKVKKETYLNEEFYLKLEEETKKSQKQTSEEEKEHNERKSSTSGKYKEIKLIGEVDLSLEEGKEASKYGIGTEIKFVIGGHDNESGLALQSIYDYAKRFRELTRLGIPIRKFDIINYVNDFFENIDEILKKKNKDKNTYFDELQKDLESLWFIKDTPSAWNTQISEKMLAMWLFHYFESKLVKVKFPHSKKIYYFDEHILKIRDAWLYKKIETI